ncbi:MAG: hypothetical protein WKF47_13450 [Geodermatophilaceae bacterium]
MGSLNFHDNPLTIGQPGAIDLRDGGGGQRSPVEFGKDLTQRSAQFGDQYLFDVCPVGWSDLILESAELIHDSRGDHIGTRREQLAELDEGDTGLVQCQPQGRGQLGLLGWILRARSPPATQVGAQPMPYGDSQDLDVPLAAGDPAAHVAAKIPDPRQRSGGHQSLGDNQEHQADQDRDQHHERQERHASAHAQGDRAKDCFGKHWEEREGEQTGHRQPDQPEPHAEQALRHRDEDEHENCQVDQADDPDQDVHLSPAPSPTRRALLGRLDNLVGDPAASEAASLRLYEVPSTVV